MIKGIIITGNDETAKCKKVVELTEKYSEREIANSWEIPAKKDTMSWFSERPVFLATKVLIVRNISKNESFEAYIYALPEVGFFINKKHQPIFHLIPELVILVCNSNVSANLLSQRGSFTSRFEIFDFFDNKISSEQAQKRVHTILESNSILFYENYLTKNLLIIGPDRSGKSLLANKIKSMVPEHETSFHTARNHRLFESPFSFCGSQETKLMILDDIRETDFLRIIHIAMYWCVFGMIINNTNTTPFIIWPKLILTCESSITMKDIKLIKEIKKYFEIIDLSEIQAEPYPAGVG